MATYVPWLWHELPDGGVDLHGRTHPQRDLAGFLDLAHRLGLRAIVRPGPFIMAEVKNEGIPYRVYDDAPEVLPTTWDGAPISTRTIDYLAPAFTEAAEGWYAAVMPVVAERLADRGGPVVAVQLDNEIGMLSWVTNSPDLTDLVCADLARWAVAAHGAGSAAARFGADPSDDAAWAAAARRPAEDRALAVHQDLGTYMRDRYRRYVASLRASAERHGVTGVPFVVNIHGTDAGRGRTYPIGISQLFASYRDQPGMTSGSDHYLGDLTVLNVADLYVANAFMAAVHGPDQPLTSMEFEAGSGDYGEDLSRLLPPEAVDLKVRLCVAQGNRMLNLYLFTGGHNPPLATPVGDGNDRIAFTGQRHGFAAPIGPEGQENPSYGRAARAFTAVRAAGDLLADGDEEYDDLALGFVPDHYLTEYHHPASVVRAAQVADLERFRGMGPRDVLARALLLGRLLVPGGGPAVRRRPAPSRGARQPGDARPRRAGAAGRAPARPAGGCCCTAWCPTATTTARRAPCSPRRWASGRGSGSTRRRTTSRRWPGRVGRRRPPRCGSATSSRWSWPTANRCSPRSAPAGRWRRRSTSARGGRSCSPVTIRATCRSGGPRWSRSGCGPGCGTTARPGVVVTSTVDRTGQRLLHLLNVGADADHAGAVLPGPSGARRPAAARWTPAPA